MDAAGFAFGIASTADLALKYFNSLKAFYDSYQDAPSAHKQIRDELDSLRSILDDLNSLVKEAQSRNDLGTLSKLQSTYEAPVKHCKEGLEKLGEKLPPNLSRRRRLLWALRGEKEAEKLVVAIQRFKSTISLALVANIRREQEAHRQEQYRRDEEHRQRLEQDRLKQEAEQVQREKRQEERIRRDKEWQDALFVQERQQQEERAKAEQAQIQNQNEKIVRWISCGVDYQTKHKTACALRQTGTGQWIFEHERFEAWKANKGTILWINGIPGNGKTILTSSIISHFSELADAQDQDLAYYYCEFRDLNSIKPDSVLRTLIAQLLTSFNIPALTHLSGLMRTANALTDNSPPVSISDLTDILILVLKTSRSPILILDALDEGADVIKLLPHLTRLHRESSNARILVTSRDEVDIREKLNEVPTISLVEIASLVKEDIRKYVISSLADTKMDESLRSQVVRTLTDKADGMFRWAQCQVDVITRCGTSHDIQNALDDLPKTLDETYRRIFLAIDELPGLLPIIAQRILWFVFGAMEPLQLEALQEAATIEPEIYSPREEFRVLHVNIILETCRGLLSVSDVKRKKLVGFSHFSVKEYIRSSRCPPRYHVDGSTVDLYLAVRALTYFQFPRFAVYVHKYEFTFGTGYAFLEFGPLYDYFLNYWEEHVNKCSPSAAHAILIPLRRLFLDHRDENHKQHLVLLHRYRDRRVKLPPFWSSFCEDKFDDIVSLCIRFGLFSILDQVLSEDSRLANTLTSSAWSFPLNQAALTGSLDIASVLLKHGADVNMACLIPQAAKFELWSTLWANGPWSPLLIAIRYNHLNLAELLLSHGANPNPGGDPTHHSAFAYCFQYGRRSSRMACLHYERNLIWERAGNAD